MILIILRYHIDLSPPQTLPKFINEARELCFLIYIRCLSCKHTPYDYVLGRRHKLQNRKRKEDEESLVPRLDNISGILAIGMLAYLYEIRT